MRHLLAMAAVLCAVTVPPAASAQTGPMPVTEVTPDAWLEALNGARIRTLYDNVGQPFLFELQDRDVANLFSYGYPPADRDLATADVVVVIRDDWAQARAVYQEIGLGFVSDNLPEPGQENRSFVNYTDLNAPNGRVIRLYTFVRFVGGEEQDERCMARLVIDDTYRGGVVGGSFDSVVCSAEID
ncbi:hypothetical protein A8B78_14445 [Jannaschia sp. EhC01]|nr:hypothetical protein A8B78_14445 [Jannaschia sp. EhC01]